MKREALAARCRGLRLIVTDVDGVLTDGTVLLLPQGGEAKAFHVRDGLAVALARRAGLPTALLSGRSSEAVTLRARELGIETVRQGVADKGAAFAELLASYRRAENGPERARSFWKMFQPLTLRWATTPHSVAGVESFPEFRDRVERALRRVMEGQRSGRRAAVFTSGGVIGTAVRLALAAPDRTAVEVNWRVRNCSLTEFVFTKNRFNLDSFNALPHLDDPTHWTYW